MYFFLLIFLAYSQNLHSQQDIDLRKAITNVTLDAPVVDHALVTYEFEICGVGSEYYTNIQISDNFAGQFDPGFVVVTNGPTAPVASAGTPVLGGVNGSFTGAIPNAFLLDGSGELATGDCISTTIEIEVDLTALNQPDFNQAIGSGEYPFPPFPIIPILVFDQSDEDIPSDPDTPVDQDDPTVLCLPDVAMAKDLVSTAPVAGMQGIYDVSFEFNVLNTGCSDLSSVIIVDDFAAEFGDAYVSTQSNPQPPINGMATLQAGQTTTVIWVVRVDMTADDAQTGLMNQANVDVIDVNTIVNTDTSTDGTDPLFGNLVTEIDLDAFLCTADASWTAPATPVCETGGVLALNLDNLNGGLDGDEVTWTGTNVTDNGVNASFDPTGLSGKINICAEVEYNSQCSDIVCYEIDVIETPVVPASVSIDQSCSAGVVGNIALTSIFAGVDFTNPGWMVTGANVVGGALVHNL